jgi:hypothetical protein
MHNDAKTYCILIHALAFYIQLCNLTVNFTNNQNVEYSLVVTYIIKNIKSI